jgi:hypothetical protein
MIQQGLLDMQFNMGGRFNPKKWPRFFDAIAAQDWSRAGRESHRHQVNAARNRAIDQLFRSALDGDDDHFK